MSEAAVALLLVAGAVPVCGITVEASRRLVPFDDPWRWRQRWAWLAVTASTWCWWLAMYVRLRAEVRP